MKASRTLYVALALSMALGAACTSITGLDCESGDLVCEAHTPGPNNHTPGPNNHTPGPNNHTPGPNN